MAATSLEDKVVLSSSPSASSKKKSKEKSGSSSSMKGTLSNSLFGGGSANNSLMSGGGVGGMGKMDVSDLPPFQQNDHSHSLTGLEGKLSNFVAGMKNHSSGLEMNNSSKSSKKKSGSESSNGSSSGGVGGGGGGGGMMANSTHLDGGGVGRSMGRGFSSGSSDGEDEKDQKKHIFRKKRGMKLPQSASGATIATSSIESDDEATDSADEGNSGGEERGSRRAGRKGDAIITTTTSGIGSLNLRQGDRVMSRKDSSESTNSATSPIPNPGHSTVFVESALPKEPLIGPNMPVGYGAAAESIAPTSGVFDKTTAQSPPGTPTMDSPKLVGDGAQFPGTPIALTPPPVESSEVCIRFPVFPHNIMFQFVLYFYTLRSVCTKWVISHRHKREKQSFNYKCKMFATAILSALNFQREHTIALLCVRVSRLMTNWGCSSMLRFNV